APAGPAADALYRTALTDFTKQSYDQAARGFLAFAQNYPQDGRAPDAQFWLAEAYRAQGQYAQAAQAFASFAQKYPDSPRAATAQVRRGESLLLSGDKGGCAVLQEVRARYARARAGVQAKDLLAQHCP
ncbi:MAG TPA: tol-pal system protein YbgF, partial [Candidatus Sulfotelmatobacter sp.]|nr:tol-pal system protein YbgF [Candidatus Sulfotelmatobacter sp.]